MSNKKPLVSVTVITYNSSRFVLETLESIKSQTYSNIELIISDDCSTDNTVELCANWLEENKERFVNTHLVTTTVNTGIPGNKNRAIAKCKGEWLKGIAGDDILADNTIEDFLKHLKNNPHIKILCSDSQSFKVVEGERILLSKHGKGEDVFFQETTTSDDQYQLSLRSSAYVQAPTVIINKEVFDKIGLYDEEIRLMEDYPYWLRVTQGGYKIHHLDFISVFYRRHDKSVFSGNKKNRIFNDFYLTKHQGDKKYLFSNISSFEKTFIQVEFYRKKFINAIGLNKRNFFGRGFNYVTHKLTFSGKYSQRKIKQIEKEILSRKE